ncbi:Gfo/Idh/MocA family protein [Actinopolymorpha alba]|uniref:Gfo/Idh/MocA family protein n=1 Tax=Actinopolymorpha alba TaxID=533267 RepID=UPI00036DA53A|nr:Gfo/Idh/MocA family oxidoreductase [Actinopolymorpha alba]
MSDLRVGLVGVNTSHAGAYARLLNERGVVEGARVAWVWGGELRSDQPDAATLAERYDIPHVATEPTERLSETDLVLVVDDTGGGAHHVPLARPFVDAGIPAFLDKPMAVDLAEAKELFALAAKRSTPVTSSSALRFAVELDAERERLAALGALSSVVSVGPGEWYYYGVHAVEQLYAVAGAGVEWVQRFTWPDRDVAVLSYADGGPSAVVQTLRDASYAFHITAYGKEDLHAVRIADFDGFYTGQVRAAAEMARTGTPPIAPEETLELLAVLRAGVLSAERDGARVRVADVLDGA